MTLELPANIHLREEPAGTLRIGGSRVTLDLVIAAFHEGASPQEIAQQLPTLDLADVYPVLGFYLHNRATIDSYLEERRLHGGELREKLESRWRRDNLRESLLARNSTIGS